MAKISFKKVADKIVLDKKKDRPPPFTIGQLMKETLRIQRELIKDVISKFPYFQTWSEDAYKEAAMISAIKEYRPDEIIYGYGKEKGNYVYFVMEGTAFALQKLRVNVKSIHGKYKYRLCSPTLSSDSNSNTADDNITKNGTDIKDIFMQLCIMTKGECFGIGNELKGSVVVAKTPVKCLIIPRYVLYNNDYANMWSRIEQFLASRLPSTDELFQQFKNSRTWVDYRTGLYDKLKPDVFYNTTLHDIPYHWRVNGIDTLYKPKIRIS